MKSYPEPVYPFSEPVAHWELLKLTDEEYAECVARRRAGYPLSAAALADRILERLSADPQAAARGSRHLVDLAEHGLSKRDYEAILHAVLEVRSVFA